MLEIAVWVVFLRIVGRAEMVFKRWKKELTRSCVLV
jgi:hypothetical protein